VTDDSRRKAFHRHKQYAEPAGRGALPRPQDVGPLARLAGRIVENRGFTALVFVVILANAAVIGAETYNSFEREHDGLLNVLNNVFLAFFAVELAIRFVAYGRRPQDFFRSGWNVFDFVVVAGGFTPGLGKDTTVLRLLRLARIVRLVTLLPDLRILVTAIGRSIPPVASIALMTGLFVYIYGIVGWMLFHDELPGRWGDIDNAMLNLFVMLSLENLPENIKEGTAVHPQSWIYFVSYALIASFLLLNVLIGIVINSMDEAREIERERTRAELNAARAARGEREVSAEEEQAESIAERLASVKLAIEDLEYEVRRQSSTHRFRFR
jgi:voltage-gated sodium channel